MIKNTCKVIFIIFISLFTSKCESDLIEANTSQLSTTLNIENFIFDSENSLSYQTTLIDSIISLSPRLYALSEANSSISLDLDISKINQQELCQADSLDLVKLELSSLNKLVTKVLNEENNSNYIITESFIDTNSLNITGNNLLLKYRIDEYDIVIDSLNTFFTDFCNIDNIDFQINYSNNTEDSNFSDYIELFSSNYSFEPSQPKLIANFKNNTFQTINNDKIEINSVSTDDEFNVYFSNFGDSFNKIFILNYNNGELDSSIDTLLNLQEVDIESAIPPSEDQQYKLNINFSLNESISMLENFLPIQLYISNIITYSDSDDPEGDNWNDCGSDGICSNDNQDNDGSENNGIWDDGEGFESNGVLDWDDLNLNGLYDSNEPFIETYYDTGYDGCFDEYEDGNGGCLNDLNPFYKPYGTQSNSLYDFGENFDDHGIDGCFDEYEDSSGGCLNDLNPDYDDIENPDPNNDNYNIDPFNDNWLDHGIDGCFDEYEDGNGGCLNDLNPDYDDTENPDPNSDNFNAISNTSGTESNNVWNNGEGTENNNKYDFGETFYDVGSDGILNTLVGFFDSDGTEDNGIWDIGEPFFDYGVDGIINYLEHRYNLDGTERNGIFNDNEIITSDYGIDGCFDEYEDGNGGCLNDLNPDYDDIENPDPNDDNFFIDFNQDNWNDCGSDGICSDDNQDNDGSENNGIWDDGEGLENNNQMDWQDLDLDMMIETSDNTYEKWNDFGADNNPDSLEFLQLGNILQSNVITNIDSYLNFNLNDTIIDVEDFNFSDSSDDLNIWISKITKNSDNVSYDAEIEFSTNLPVKAIEFDFRHFLLSYQDSLLNDFTNILTGNSFDTFIDDRSVYDIDYTYNENDIILDFSNGIQSSIKFDSLDFFIKQDSTIFISTNDSNLLLYLKDRSDFDQGYSDIYYDGMEDDIFLKRVYYDDEDRVVIPIGNLLQKFIDKELVYDGINLKLSGDGYNFNRLNFHSYEDPNSNECGYAGCADSLNPKLEVLFSK